MTKQTVKDSQLGTRIRLCILLSLIFHGHSWGGAFLYSDSFPGVVTHPLGYTGTLNNQQVTLNICIDAASQNANELLIPVQNSVNTWNALSETTGNLKTNQLASGKLDVESVFLHELGHCIGLAHPNVANTAGTGAPTNSTASTKGPNSGYDLDAGSDGIYGSADDLRGDDENVHWFNQDNNPFIVIPPVDQYSYKRTLNHLPAGDSFAANADRNVSTAMGYQNTEAAMQQETFVRETQRELAADDVSSLLFARTGKDRIAGNADDYSVTLNFNGIVSNASANSSCDISVSIDSSSSFAYCSTSGFYLSYPDPDNFSIKSAEIHLGTAYNWYFNTLYNAQSEYLNFYNPGIADYAGSQDGAGTIIIQNNGSSLTMEGNKWQQVEVNYAISDDTVVEFDFSSSSMADIHGIGFNNDLDFNPEHTFQLDGSQAWGLQNYHNYETGQGIKHYVIPVGQFYSGVMQYLFFINDHDVESPDGQSLFSNLRIYENTETLQAPTITSTPASSVVIGNSYTYNAGGSGADPVNFSLQKGPDGLGISANGQLSWTPGAGQEGTHPVTILASNAAGSTSQSFAITVNPVTPPVSNVLNFNNLSPAGYAGQQDATGLVTIEDDTLLDDGARLRLTGNRWQQVVLNYPITTNTMIEFDFSSNVEGEIHGIGFNDKLNFIENHTFQLSGTQLWGRQNFYGYTTASGVQHYVIPVGKYYIGTGQYLYFINDHDVASPDAESVFSNVEVYESN